MKLKLVGEISNIETIAKGSGIRDRALLVAQFGLGNWLKKKGVSQNRTYLSLNTVQNIHRVGWC